MHWYIKKHVQIRRAKAKLPRHKENRCVFEKMLAHISIRANAPTLSLTCFRTVFLPVVTEFQFTRREIVNCTFPRNFSDSGQKS